MSVLSRARALAVAVALAMGACGGAGGGRVVVVTNEVSVTFAPGGPAPPFDPHAARITAASRQLAAIVGHPIVLEIDGALIPPLRRSFDVALADAIEQLAQDLRRTRDRDSDLFAREVPKLTRVALRYSAIGERSSVFDPKTGVVVVTEAAGRELLYGGEVPSALEEQLDEERDQRFLGKEPEAVAPADRAEYFYYVTHWRMGPTESKRWHALSEAERDATSPANFAIGRIVRLSALVGTSDPTLAANTREWLVARGDDFVRLHRMGGGVERDDPASPRYRSKVTWVAWLNAVLPTLRPEERLEIGRAVLDDQQPFPGFDMFAFGLQAVDDWIAAGHPTHGADDDARFRLMDLVVCPVTIDARGRPFRGVGCRSAWLHHALASDAEAKRLADALAMRLDRPLMTSFVETFHYGSSGDDLRLLHVLERTPRAWHLVASEILEQQRYGHSVGLYLKKEADRWWHDVPAYRGTALYVFALKYDPWGLEMADREFSRFARDYGEVVGPALFASYLDEGRGAMQLVPRIWRALGQGWSRADPIVAHLGAFLADPSVRAKRDQEPEATVHAIVERFCEDGSTAEIAKIHAGLVAHARTSPADASLVENLIVDTAPGRCAKKKR